MLTAFSPILGDNPRVLILGSMPSQRSLEVHEYYAHPQNSFWWIMSVLFDFDLDAGYEDRTYSVSSRGVAIWDVLQHCEREGSLDSKIKRDSEISNDFPSFFKQNSNVNFVLFNGQAAAVIFRRHHPELAQTIGLSTIVCPSTSPANARMTKQEKLCLWQSAFGRADIDFAKH